MKNRIISVTQPYLPPLDEFLPYLEQIWENKILTNNGPYHQQLEESLCAYLGVKYISLFTNGTIALLTALKALEISGEVITTPYSFVATAHSIFWNKIKPVFVDIDPFTLNLDADKIEAAITENTTAIMPVHCYGYPCNTIEIQKIAEKHNLHVIYDAAHAFGVEDVGGSILRHGDLSVLSFHATKVFNTFEGGAIVSHDDETKERIDRLKNFGIVSETEVVFHGINGKMSEICAAFGLLQLEHMNEIIQSRREIDALYRKLLFGINGIRCLSGSAAIVKNYSYFPVLVESDYKITRDELYYKLKENQVHARRYFYPLITEYPMYKQCSSGLDPDLPVAIASAQKIICLPIYPSLTKMQVEFIAHIIQENE